MKYTSGYACCLSMTTVSKDTCNANFIFFAIKYIMICFENTLKETNGLSRFYLCGSEVEDKVCGDECSGSRFER